MGWVVKATLRPLYPRKRPSTQWYRRLGGPQGRSDRVRKITPSPEFDPRTVQRLASVGDDNTKNTSVQSKRISWSVIHFMNKMSLFFYSSLFLSIPPFLHISLPQLSLFPTGTQSHTATDVCTRSTQCRRLCCRVTNTTFSGSNWLSVRGFVLDLQRGLNWVS
jgi:hypothetical protein